MTVRVLLVSAMVLATAGCLKKEIQTGLGEQEAQEIIVVLKEHGLDGVKRPSGAKEPSWTVFVKGGDHNLVHAWRVLQDNGLPRAKDRGLEQVFANSGMIPTASEEKARLITGLSGEIGRTLKSVSGVVDARVHVVLPENSPLVDRSQWSPTTASVLIKHQGKEPPLKDAEIRALVARGVEGLQPDNVAIVLNRVVPKAPPPRDVFWYAGNQQILVLSLLLLALTSAGGLAVVARSRRQRTLIESLRAQLQAAARPQANAESAGQR